LNLSKLCREEGAEVRAGRVDKGYQDDFPAEAGKTKILPILIYQSEVRDGGLDDLSSNFSLLGRPWKLTEGWRTEKVQEKHPGEREPKGFF